MNSRLDDCLALLMAFQSSEIGCVFLKVDSVRAERNDEAFLAAKGGSDEGGDIRADCS
jgi:hypothetical protein